MNFEIDPAHLTDIVVHKLHRPYAGKQSLTPDELVDVLSCTHTMTSMSTQDHPEFAKLRSQLEAEGYIKCEHGWCNGDQVIRPFAVNSYQFESGDRFLCAAALGIQVKVSQRTATSNSSDKENT